MLEKIKNVGSVAKNVVVNNKKKVVAGLAIGAGAIATAVIGGIAIAKGGSDDFIEVADDSFDVLDSASDSFTDAMMDVVEEVVE